MFFISASGLRVAPWALSHLHALRPIFPGLLPHLLASGASQQTHLKLPVQIAWIFDSRGQHPERAAEASGRQEGVALGQCLYEV